MDTENGNDPMKNFFSGISDTLARFEEIEKNMAENEKLTDTNYSDEEKEIVGLLEKGIKRFSDWDDDVCTTPFPEKENLWPLFSDDPNKMVLKLVTLPATGETGPNRELFVSTNFAYQSHVIINYRKTCGEITEVDIPFPYDTVIAGMQLLDFFDQQDTRHVKKIPDEIKLPAVTPVNKKDDTIRSLIEVLKFIDYLEVATEEAWMNLQNIESYAQDQCGLPEYSFLPTKYKPGWVIHMYRVFSADDKLRLVAWLQELANTSTNPNIVMLNHYHVIELLNESVMDYARKICKDLSPEEKKEASESHCNARYEKLSKMMYDKFPFLEGEYRVWYYLDACLK